MNNNVKGLIILIALISSLASFHWFPFYSSTTITIYASEDAEVYSKYPTSNYGSITSALVAQNPPNEYSYFWMKFDLSDIPSYATITRILLYTYISDVGSYASPPDNPYYEVTRGLSNSWSESTITWSNQPGLSAGAPVSKLLSTGWVSWDESFYKDYANQQLKSDKKISLVLVVDRDYPDIRVWAECRTKEYGGGFKPYIAVTYEIPYYTLTVSIKDANGNPIQGASITSPFSGTTDANGLASASVQAGTKTLTFSYKGFVHSKQFTLDTDKTVTYTIPVYTLQIKVVDANGNPIPDAVITSPVSGTTDSNGVFQTSLPEGRYTVAVAVGSKTSSQSVALDTNKQITVSLAVTYSLALVVKDQAGNPLPATVTIDQQKVTCDKYGTAKIDISSGTHTVTAEITVGTKTFSTTETITVSKSMTKELVIERKFLWKFFINYTDGTPATGTIIASSTDKGTVNIPITNGYGEGYLDYTTYTFSFEASPAVTLKTVTISNDGEFYATINKEEETAETSHTEIPTTSPESPTVTPEVPWILIPSVYIYGLLGVLVLGFIIAAAVRLRRPPK